jgi:hypothetical protein
MDTETLQSDRREELGIDGRKNIADENGISYFVYDSERERTVAGPFESQERADRVMAQSNWPWPEDLATGSADAADWLGDQ